ncbi:hypothetical protein B0H19DRAFT_1055150 [Mycena capillaripes]|nr:hypothetical protein B0H19DRAFT_1055150 [Mycena capillaripes]
MASLLELARRRRAARPAPSTPVNPEPRTSPPADGSSPPPNPQSDSDATPNPFAPSAISQVVRLKNFGKRALKRIKLSDELQAEFRQYIEMTSLEERYALQFIHTLQVEDLLNKEVEECNSLWKPSKALAKTLREYIWTLLLLPNIRYYAGTVENAVISAARSNKVKGLPAASMEDGSELRNIADLAENLLQHAPGLNATLGLYYRIVFIRCHLRLFNHSIHDFWSKVDEELEEMHDAGPEDFLESMKVNFEEDIAVYKDPVKSTHRPSSDTFDDGCMKDLKTLSPLAPKIQRVVARKRATKGKKRKLRDELENEDEQLRHLPLMRRATGHLVTAMTRNLDCLFM